MAAQNETTKVFRGATVPETMMQVRQEFGPNAVIINKREIPAKKGLFKLISGPMVEIVAADADYRLPPTRPAGAGSLLERAYGQSTVPTAPSLQGDIPPGVELEISGGGRPGGIAQVTPPARPQTGLYDTQPQQAPAPEAASLGLNDAAWSTLLSTIQSKIHDEALRFTSSMACGNIPPVGERLLEVYQQLLEKGVEASIAKDLTMKLQYDLGVSPDINEALLADCLRQRLAEEFRVAPPGEGAPGAPRVIALVGPCGSGKTTTVVKLAFAAFNRSQKVGIITEDGNRPGAESQLRTLTQLMTLPLFSANTPAQLAETVRNLGEMDLIIVDTAGRGFRDRRGMEELRDNLAAVNPQETHLALPATMDGRSAIATADAYRVCGYNRLLVTKLDEAVSFGLLVNLARKIPEKFTYLTLGNKDYRSSLAAATPEYLARLVNGDCDPAEPEAK